jgi:hypothetical protein
MPPSRAWRVPSAVLLLAAILGTSAAVAQSDLPTLTSTSNVSIPTASSGGATSAGSSDSSATSATDSGSSSGEGTTTVSLPALSSDSSSASETGTAADLPALSTSFPSLTGFPTLPGGYNYPAPTVPPMANAPYLRKSNLPQDTVFIIVGAVIAFVAFVILAWRVLVAWSINRSVRNTTTAGYSRMGDLKAGRRKSSGLGPYGGAPMGSSMSLEKLGTGSRNGTSNFKSQTPNPSLFFSPTAGAGTHTYNSSRASNYLPSGYYNAGTAAPGGGTGMTTIGGGGDRGSKLRPQPGAFVTARAVDPSPPESPDVRPSTGGTSIGDSRSSLHLGPTGDRTPSTYLDDLMSNGVPSASRHGYTGSRASLGRDRDIRRY